MPNSQAEFLLNITQNEAQKGYDLLTLRTKSGLMDNIMQLGLMQAQQRVLHKENGCQNTIDAPEEDKGDKE